MFLTVYIKNKIKPYFKLKLKFDIIYFRLIGNR
jgi:hypothetical protein